MKGCILRTRRKPKPEVGCLNQKVVGRLSQREPRIHVWEHLEGTLGWAMQGEPEFCIFFFAMEIGTGT
eukprot:1132498-Rhodomonas_salina.2